jgi:hypothetical protein
MSELKSEFGKETVSGDLNAPAHARRYSLKVMMAEVRSERTHSALGRELLDSTEIDKIFIGRRREKTKRR